MAVEFYKLTYKGGRVDIYKVKDNIVYNPCYSDIYFENAELWVNLSNNLSKLTLEDLIIYKYIHKYVWLYEDYIREFLESL
jgi:hypothetical protein